MTTEPDLFLQRLERARAGDAAALNELMPMVYDELRRIAQRHLRRERSGHTLQATAVVNEAYLRLAQSQQASALSVESRAHFMALAAQVIRRVLLDYAASRNTEKRGSGAVAITLSALDQLTPVADDAALAAVEFQALHQALSRLALLDPRAASVVEMRYFSGMGHAEIAIALSISEATVKREWSTARLWLKQALAN